MAIAALNYCFAWYAYRQVLIIQPTNRRAMIQLRDYGQDFADFCYASPDDGPRFPTDAQTE
jgi:hypothetical protein